MSLLVECYSGYAYAERPVAFVWQGRRYKVEQVLKQWRAPEGPGFWVTTPGGAQFELLYNESTQEWTCEHKGE